MSMFRKITAIALSVVALFGATILTAPAADAATYTYQRQCYKIYNLYTYCTWRPVLQAGTPVPTAPKPTTPPPAPQPAPAPAAGLTADEQQMLNLVNQERAKQGLNALKADLALTKVARVKSQDLITNNYFAHNSPTYGSPFEMMKQFGITYRSAGENLAGNSSVSAAHTALMNSTGHRANILNSSYTHVGIGIVKGGKYGTMFTQMFVGR